MVIVEAVLKTALRLPVEDRAVLLSNALERLRASATLTSACPILSWGGLESGDALEVATVQGLY